MVGVGADGQGLAIGVARGDMLTLLLGQDGAVARDRLIGVQDQRVVAVPSLVGEALVIVGTIAVILPAVGRHVVGGLGIDTIVPQHIQLYIHRGEAVGEDLPEVVHIHHVVQPVDEPHDTRLGSLGILITEVRGRREVEEVLLAGGQREEPEAA